MRWVAVAFVLGTCFCFASPCPDPRLRQAEIGGDTINGSVVLHQNPVKSALVRLYFSTGKTAWVGVTDKDGNFRITDLQPDTYRLDVRGWGSTTIRLDPALNQLPNGQVPSWHLTLDDDECVGAGFSLD